MAVSYGQVEDWVASWYKPKGDETNTILGVATGTTGPQSQVKLRSFDDAVRFIDDDGSFKGHTSSYYMIKEAEALLAKYGFCEIVGEVHPVDTVANFVVSNKWYWGGVLGLSAIPGLVVGLDELKRLEHEITS